jgi:hypothetical protein
MTSAADSRGALDRFFGLTSPGFVVHFAVN